MKAKIPVPLGDGSKVEVVHFEYYGKPVLTTKQLAKLFGTTDHVIRQNFRRHKDEFVEEVDYFKLETDGLREFKGLMRRKARDVEFSFNRDSSNANLINRDSSNAKIDSIKLLNAINELLKGPSLNLWTKFGTFRHSRIMESAKAKIIYSALALGYFETGNDESPIQDSLFETKENPADTITEKPTEENNNSQSKLETLMELIRLTTDEDLRNKLIREAAKLITGKDF